MQNADLSSWELQPHNDMIIGHVSMGALSPNVAHWPTGLLAVGFVMVSRPDNDGKCPAQVCCMLEIELSPSPQIRADDDLRTSKKDG